MVHPYTKRYVRVHSHRHITKRIHPQKTHSHLDLHTDTCTDTHTNTLKNRPTLTPTNTCEQKYADTHLHTQRTTHLAPTPTPTPPHIEIFIYI